MEKRLEFEVGAVLCKFIDQGKQFTAVDIGNELKKKCINARQREISPLVRKHFSYGDLFEDTGYTRELIPVQGGRFEAFLYFNMESDPMEYTATEQDTLPWDPEKDVFDDDISDVVQGNGQNGSLYLGSKKSNVIHSPNCQHAARIKQDNQVGFSSMSDAADEDYRLCKKEE